MAASSTWALLGGGFPPSLNKIGDPTALVLNESPDAFGLDTNGFLKSGSCPAGTARISKTYTIGSTVYQYWYDRAWAWNGTRLTYGAPNYTATLFRQGLGEIDFLEDASAIVACVPFSNSIAVFKTTGGYIIGNANDNGGNFSKGPMRQDMHVATSTHATELGGIVYFTNASGLFALLPDGQVLEVSAKLRGTTTMAPFASSPLTCDYNQRYVIGTTNKWCYDTLYKKLFDYSTSGFRYTTPTLRMKARGYEGNPFSVDALAIEYRFLSSANTAFQFQTNVGDRGWGSVASHTVANMAGNPSEDLCRVLISLESPRNGRSFALRLTALDAHIEVSRIWASSSSFEMEGYTE